MGIENQSATPLYARDRENRILKRVRALNTLASKYPREDMQWLAIKAFMEL